VIEKPSEQQRQEMAKQAHSISEKFRSMTKSMNGEEDKPNLYTEKVKRYKQYVIDKLVRIDDDTHELYSQWIMRAQAQQMNMEYHCPVKWLQERGVNV